MIAQFFSNPTALRHLHVGPLCSYIAGYAVRLSEEGYATATAREHIRLIAALSDWLDRRRLGADDVSEQTIARFLKYRRRRGQVRRGDAAALRAFLTMMREAGATPALAPAVDASEIDRIEQRFARHLAEERGLAPATLRNYLPTARHFLSERFGRGSLKIEVLSPKDVSRFILRHAPAMSPRRAQLVATALRSFLRFLYRHGDTATDLAATVPAVADWRLSHLPKYLEAAQVESLLRHCDQSHPTCQRDYAVLLLMGRLGLRAGEVVAMRLDDLDWEAGELMVRGKGARRERLPLPRDVGEALASYLRHTRPDCATRQVFVRMKAPRRGFASSVAICSIVRRALKRAGLNPWFKGAHLLRHSLATQMLRQGASLAEIGDVLRHRLPNTTQIYAKVDHRLLRALAQPWPGDVP